METRLSIEIHNKNSVPLTVLTVSLLNMAQQYARFLDRNGIELRPDDEILYIQNIKAGSIILDLSPHLAYALPLFQDFNTTAQFVIYLTQVFQYLLGRNIAPPINFDKKDLVQLHDSLKVVAKDPGSNINFVAHDGSNQTINLNINYLEANAIQNNINKELDKLEKEKQTIFTKQLLTWYQTRFSKNSGVGDKAIIEAITKMPVKVIFDNDEVKKQIINTTLFDKPWQNLAYLVDLEVMYINDVPKRYKILNFHPEETFDPMQDD